MRLVALTVRLLRGAYGLGAVDVVHANDLSTLPAAILLARRHRARLVYDAHELYAEEEASSPRLYRAVLEVLERRLARRADEIVTVSEPLARELQQRLGVDRRPRVVLNCPPLLPSEPPARTATGTLRAIYQGALGPQRPLDDLLAAAEWADGVELTIRVRGVDRRELERAIAARGLGGRVQVADPVPPDRLVPALHSFDVGVIFNRPATMQQQVALPNRLFEYMMAGLAVVAPDLPALRALVDAEGIGVLYEPGRPDRLGAALAALARDRSRVRDLGNRARRRAVERYNAEAEAVVLTRAWGIAD
jgi:glycosyltransferase involved in cell wall biosynthesis